jgi:perosamine synthetase
MILNIYMNTFSISFYSQSLLVFRSTPSKKIASSAPFFDDYDIALILEDIGKILKSKKLVLGPYTQKFEELFSEYTGTKYAVALSSATSALEIALRYCNVKDSEVIVPTNTFIACPNTVVYAGGKPVFADMNPNSFCIDIDDVQRKISSKTKAIMVVHFAGMPEPEIDVLREICNDRRIYLIEDCSHSHGATWNGRKVGSYGIAGCFSFFATKILATGTGGILTTNDPDLKSFAELLRHQGGIGSEGQIEVFDKYGYDWMMSEVTAAIGISQLLRLDQQIKKRRAIANEYDRSLRHIKDIKCLPHYSKGNNIYWKFITLLAPNIDRDRIKSILRKAYNIEAGILYPTLCHMQPIYRNLGYQEGECPTAESVMKHQLTLPVNPYMILEDVAFVVEALKNTISITACENISSQL